MESFERQESEKGSEIDLSRVAFEYISDDEIDTFFNEQLALLEKPDELIKSKSHQFEHFKQYLLEHGYPPEQIEDRFVQHEKQKIEKEQTKILPIKELVEENKQAIFEQVQIKLSAYLPDWQPGETKVVFTISKENFDYRHPQKGMVITNLRSLSSEDRPIDDAIYGITHELFHEWMCEVDKRSRTLSDTMSLDGEKWLGYYEVADEGMAVLISGQSLAQHYEKQGKDYETAIQESFIFFRNYLTITDIDTMKEARHEGLRNMGPFYVVGYEMARVVRDKIGMEKFRNLTASLRDDPMLLFKYYNAICLEDDSISKIE